MSAKETYGRSLLNPTVGRLDDLPWVVKAIHGRVLRGPLKPSVYADSEKPLPTQSKRGPSTP